MSFSLNVGEHSDPEPGHMAGGSSNRRSTHADFKMWFYMTWFLEKCLYLFLKH
jgi:hypothetical protein